MSKRFTSKEKPQNSGKNRIYTLNNNGLSYEITKILNVSIVEGRIVFERTDELIFGLLLSENILSIIPRVELEINGKEVAPDNMYILEVNDKITFDEFVFEIAEKDTAPASHEISAKDNQTPPDITTEMLIPRKELNKEKKKKEKKKKEKPSKKPTFDNIGKPKNGIRDKKSANSLVRVIAILIESLIVAICLEFFVIDKDFLDLIGVNEIDLSFLKMDFDPTIIYSFIASLVGFYFLRVISALVLGVTLGQFLIGVTEVSGVFTKRIKAVFRELIGIFTGCILILDLPSLISRRTFKEVITASNIKSGGFLKTFVLSILALALFSAAWFVAPIIAYEGNLSPISVNPTMLKRRLKPNEEQKVQSNQFGLAISDEMAYLPFFKVKRVGRSVISTPELRLYPEVEISIKYVKSLDLKALLKKAAGNNLLIATQYPTIAKVAFNKPNPSVELKVDKSELTHEILMLIKSAYSLNLESSFDHVMKYGPFIKGLLNFRKSLDSALDRGFIGVNYKSIAGRFFIEFKVNAFQSRLVEVDLNKADVIDVKSRDSNYSKELFAVSEANLGADNLMFLIDTFLRKDFSQTSLERSFRVSLEFLKDQLNKETKAPKEDIVESFSSQVSYLNTMKKTIKDKNVQALMDKYVQNLSDLIRAYKEEDKGYFGLPIESVEEAEEEVINE